MRPSSACASALALAALGTASTAAGQDAGSSARGIASATVREPLRVDALELLDFGWVTVPENASGSVTVSPHPGGSLTFEGAAIGGCEQAGCIPHPAAFAVRGEPDRQYRIDVPGGLTASGMRAGSVPLAIDRLAVRSASLPEAGSHGRLDERGQDRFSVGGTLHIPAGARGDRYVARLPVMVNYE